MRISDAIFSVSKSRAIAGAGLAFFAAWLSLAHAEDVAAPLQSDQQVCADAEKTASELRQRIGQGQATLAGLTAFISGKSLGDTPVVSLFTVDIADDAAIERRVEGLRKQLESNTPGPAIAALLACAHEHPVHAQLAKDLADLQMSIARSRLDFLSLPRERRDALINAQESVLIHADKASMLDQDRASAEEHQTAASRSIETAEEKSRTAATADLRELAANRAVLEKTREELASIKIKFSTGLRARADAHKNTAERLSSLAGSLTQASSPEKILQSYEEAASIWRSQVDQTFERIADPQRYEPVPDLPAIPEVLLARTGTDESALAYRAAYVAARTEHGQLAKLRQERYADERNNVFRLLLAASKLRSELLKENVAIGNTQVTALSTAYFADLYREIRIVPYRLYAFITTKLLDFREKARGGFEGMFDIAGQLLIFALFVSIPFMVYRAMRWATGKLEGLRHKMIREQISLPEAQQRSARITTIVIQRVTAYLPWVVMLLGIWLADRLVAGTVFAEISAVLPYLGYYIWFRIFVVFVSGILGIIAYTGTMQGLTIRRKRLQYMAQRVGAFFFIAFALLHATQDVVGEALVYQLVVAIIIYLGLIICAVAARSWREEIISASKRVLPSWAAGYLKQYCTGWLSWIVCLPAMILVITGMLVMQFNNWAGRTDVLKRIGAELFRRRVEGASPDKADGKETDGQHLPDEYLDWFDLGAPADATLLIEPTSGILADVPQVIEAWKHSAGGEHSLAIIGDKGSGKSSLLRVIESNCNGCHIIKITIPPKLVTRDAVLTFFSEHMRHDLSRGAVALADVDGTFEKTLVLVDEAHNLYLGAIGGFDGYRAFMELVNAGTSNLFWCATFNRRSWDYLRGVFGSSQYFRNVMTLPPMTDADIQNLILTRHKRTGFNLSYDAIIRATQSPEDFGGLAHIETQFFRLLWGQSKGNPRAAIVLWVSALQAAGGKRLKVGIPHYKPIRGLENVGDDALFVYATIIRHENLTAEEAIATVNLSPGVVHDAIRIGIDTKAIVMGTDRRYRVSPTAQFALIQLLMGKNLIHE